MELLFWVYVHGAQYSKKMSACGERTNRVYFSPVRATSRDGGGGGQDSQKQEKRYGPQTDHHAVPRHDQRTRRQGRQLREHQGRGRPRRMLPGVLHRRRRRARDAGHHRDRRGAQDAPRGRAQGGRCRHGALHDGRRHLVARRRRGGAQGRCEQDLDLLRRVPPPRDDRGDGARVRP